jgi:hypothetical protein
MVHVGCLMLQWLRQKIRQEVNDPSTGGASRSTDGQPLRSPLGNDRSTMITAWRSLPDDHSLSITPL